MKRTDLRGLCCAFLGLGLLIASYPAGAQQAAPPAAAKPAAKAAAKPAKKAVRWAPRWRRYTRWNRYSRWARRPYAAKPAAAWHPAAWSAAKPAAKPAVKPAWHPATAGAAKPAWVKPASKSAWHPATTTATKPAWKPAQTASHTTPAKTVSKPVVKPMQATAHATPAAKLAISTAHATPKPAAKAAAKPVAKSVGPTPESMTRDANNGGPSAVVAAPLAGGQLDLGGTIGRWIGWLVAVLLAIAGGLYLARRYKLVQAGGKPNEDAYAQPANGAKSFGFGGGLTPVFSNLGGRRQAGAPVLPNGQALAQSGIGDGGLQIVGAQPLPGSGTTIYLVRIEDHMVLLGASYAGGVRTLAEWEKDDQPEAADEKETFDSFLRRQGSVDKSQREDEEHTFASIRARLNSTADRLAGLRADFGA